MKQKKILGCRVELPKGIRPDFAAFGESQSRVVVSCKPENVQAVIEEARKQGIDVKVIGKVTDDGRIRIGDVIDVKTLDMLEIYNNAIKKKMEKSSDV